MYAWIWRHLPFGLFGKLTGSLMLAGAAAALLWFVVFPWMDPWLEEALLPWDDSQLQSEVPGGDIVDPDNPAVPAPTGSADQPVGPDGEVVDDPHDIPYQTDE